MRRKPVIILALTVALLSAAVLHWRYNRPELPHFRLSDGAEFRVIQLTYTPHASDALDHNIGGAPKAAFWLFNLLPRFLWNRLPQLDRGIGSTASNHPAISIWWARIDPATHHPELGPAGDVLMTFDSGDQFNLGWPSPNDPGYRQIFVTDPPRNSKHLAFEVPVEGERVHFTIDNPAYHR